MIVGNISLAQSFSVSMCFICNGPNNNIVTKCNDYELNSASPWGIKRV